MSTTQLFECYNQGLIIIYSQQPIFAAVGEYISKVWGQLDYVFERPLLCSPRYLFAQTE